MNFTDILNGIDFAPVLLPGKSLSASFAPRKEAAGRRLDLHLKGGR